MEDDKMKDLLGLTQEEIQAAGEESFKQINQIRKMIKEYYRIIKGNLTSEDMFLLGMNTILAGLEIANRSSDMENSTMEERIATMKILQTTVNGIMQNTYLNPDVVAKQVERASQETAKRNVGKLKKVK